MITTNQASFLHRRFLPQALIVVVAFLGFLQAPVLSFAQDVAARISTRETYVGMPIVLEIQVANASDYKLPELFEIEGCRVESGGRPSTSSRVMISNGRRTESRSVTQTYVITPKREGKFEIPNLVVEVDGKTRNVLKQSFVVTKSETGDLMFVEIEGSKQKVYVGEPLDLKLKIWLKPFQDREQKIQLDDGNMWQMLSEKTSWGEFGDRVAELAENRQRPSGKEVLKDDGEGTERGYFLYELETTVYPDRPGKIDGSDVQVVVNYPLAIGRARDPFESIFDDRRSPASSMLQRMMSDDFGGGLRSVEECR